MSIQLQSLSNEITVAGGDRIGISAPGVGASGTFNLSDQQQLVYVSKVGNNSNSGLNLDAAKLTIAGALITAIAMTPSESNQITIQIVDTGTYTETFTQPEWIHIHALLASIDGEVDIEDNCILKVRRLQHTAPNGACVSKINGTGLSKVQADIMIVASSTNDGIFVKLGQIGCTIGTIVCTGGNALLARAGSRLVFDVQYMRLNSSGRGLLTSTTGGSANYFSGNILLVDDDGTGRFIRTVASNDSVNIQGGSFLVNQLYDMGMDSFLNLYAHETTGSRAAVSTAQVNIVDTSGDSNLEGDLNVDGAITRSIQSISSTTATQAKSDSLIKCDTSSNDVTVNLLAAASWIGQPLNIKKTSALNKIVIDPNGSETIDGALTFEFFNDNESITIMSDGTGVQIV